MHESLLASGFRRPGDIGRGRASKTGNSSDGDPDPNPSTIEMWPVFYLLRAGKTGKDGTIDSIAAPVS
jgi:hypothetical protein